MELHYGTSNIPRIILNTAISFLYYNPFIAHIVNFHDTYKDVNLQPKYYFESWIFEVDNDHSTTYGIIINYRYSLTNIHRIRAFTFITQDNVDNTIVNEVEKVIKSL